jgi:hypothetical protein
MFAPPKGGKERDVPPAARERLSRAAAPLRERAARHGVDIHALATYLGHGDPGFTLRAYVHLMPDAADRMRVAVDHVLATGGADGPVAAQGGRYEQSAW